MIYGEDHSQVHTASGPRVMATLRNLAIAILRLAGATSIAAALRHHSRRPSRPLQTPHGHMINDFAEALGETQMAFIVIPEPSGELVPPWPAIFRRPGWRRPQSDAARTGGTPKTRCGPRRSRKLNKHLTYPLRPG